MRNFTFILAILWLLCFSLIYCAIGYICDGASEEMAKKEAIENATAEETEDIGAKVMTDKLSFSPLEYCDGNTDYFLQNDIIRIFRVENAPGLYRVFFETVNLDQALQNFNLTVITDGRVQNVEIRYLFPITKYEIVIRKGNQSGFQILSAVWNPTKDLKLGIYKKFGKLLCLKGTNTIQYAGFPKTIMIFDDDSVCTGIYELGWFGTKVINNGAEYYKVVQR